MSPVGGAGGRRLRGAPGFEKIEARCVCGYSYTVSPSALGRARCRKCKVPTQDLAVRPAAL